MTLSRMAVLGAVVSTAALMAGQGSAQISPPTGPQLAIQPPRLESLLGSNGSCSTNGPVFSSAANYNGTADVFEGPLSLVLTGERLSQLSDIAVVLPGGQRLAPESRTSCANGSVRVSFAIPAGTRSARLELLAPKPAPLVNAPKPVQTCTDRLTGKPTACPELPAAASPGTVKVADVGLTMVARPALDRVTPDRITGSGTGTCRGVVVFTGRGLAAARLVAETGPIPFNDVINSQTATSINATLTKGCSAGTLLDTIIRPAAFVRRGTQGGMAEIVRCDTCTGDTTASFLGTTVRFVGN